MPGPFSCCHDPMGHHYGNEPETCCHTHVQDLPGNQGAHMGEAPKLPEGWTVQEQNNRDALTTEMAKLKEQIEADAPEATRRELIKQLHRHMKEP